MSDQLIAERSGLEKKDKGELQTIVSALGGKASGRSRKSELIDQILELSGAEFPEEASDASAEAQDDAGEVNKPADGEAEEYDSDDEAEEEPSSDVDSSNSSSNRSADGSEHDDGGVDYAKNSRAGKGKGKGKGSSPKDSSPNGSQSRDASKDGAEEDEPNKRRRRGRGRGRGRDRESAGNEPIIAEPFEVEGFLELRDEGYGFLRVNGLLPSRDDVYVSVKQVRQYGLRKGDHLAGLSRPANRNEKNPGFHQIDGVNGQSPDDAIERPNFDELNPVFPDHEIQLHPSDGPAQLAPSLVDLFAPLGRGQRVLLSAPPQAGATTFIKDLCQSIEQNNPNITLLVLLVDQRPEEVSWLRSELSDGEVIASPYDRPAEEHCAVAEITVERAKRLAESGQDVCVVVDSFSKLVRAYQATSNQNSRGNAGVVDGAAMFAAKKLFGAARKLEQGGSFTMIATAQIDTGAPEGEAIARELASAANSHMVLSSELAQAGVFPALDVTASATRREDLLLGEDQAIEFGRLRNAIVEAIASHDSLSAGTAKLHQQVNSSGSIDDFLAEIMKSLS